MLRGQIRSERDSKLDMPMPLRRQPIATASGGSTRRAWCPAGASRSRQLAVSAGGTLGSDYGSGSSEELPFQFSNKHCSSKPKKPTNPEQTKEPSLSSYAEEQPMEEEPSLEEVPEKSPPPPPPPPPPPQKQQARKQSKKEGLDFSYLKDGLTADSSKDPEGEEARRAALESVEAALADAQARADRLVELAAAASADPAGEPPENSGRCATMEEARQLKRCIAGLGDILSRLRRNQPVALASREPGARGGGPLLAGCPHSGRNRLAELRSRYERSLLLTPTDVSWPFVHLIAPAWPAPPSAMEDCRSANCWSS